MKTTLNGFVDLTNKHNPDAKLNANNEPIDEYNEFDLTDDERSFAMRTLAELNTNGVDMKTLKQCYYADQLDWASGLSDEELREELENHIGQDNEK